MEHRAFRMRTRAQGGICPPPVSSETRTIRFSPNQILEIGIWLGCFCPALPRPVFTIHRFRNFNIIKCMVKFKFLNRWVLKLDPQTSRPARTVVGVYTNVLH
jgi:hypothetical protein